MSYQPSVHAMLTEAGIPRSGYRNRPIGLATRVGLLIDERNSLKDELEQLREQVGWGERGVPPHA